MAGDMLLALAQRPLGAGELAERFRERIAEDLPADRGQIVGALIAQLDQLGLIEPLAP